MSNKNITENMDKLKFFKMNYPFKGCNSCSKTYDQVLDKFDKYGSFCCDNCQNFITAYFQGIYD